MNAMTPIPSLIPENAPFSSEQRAWLNGFFAAYLGVDGGRLPTSAAAAADRRSRRGVPLARRRRSAWPSAWNSPRTRKPQRQLMAAMAQLDCGQCGYLCQTYAEAVWSGAEADMGRCVPGGKETQRKLKELMAALEPQRDGEAVAAPAVKAVGAARHARPAGARHPGRCPSAQPPRLREGRAARRVRSVDHRPHLRGGRQSRRLRAQEPAARAGRARSPGRQRRGDGGVRRRCVAAAPGAAEQGRHRAAERRLPDVPGDARLQREEALQAAGAGARRGAGRIWPRPTCSTCCWPFPR